MQLAVVPILVPFVFMIIHLVMRKARTAAISAISGSFLMLVSAAFIMHRVHKHGMLHLQAGGWDAPFGISIAIDGMSALFLLTASIITFSVSIFALRLKERETHLARFYFFFFSLILGINGALITGDIFNLYVWFEIMLLSSFVLITLGFSKDQMRAGIKYMAMNLVGSLFFLAGIGLLYGKTGTLNMAHLAEILMNDKQAILINTSAMLFFLAFGIKAAVFPLYFWLPSSYHTPDITVSTLFSGILTKVGVYAMFRFFTLFFVQDQVFWQKLLIVVAGFTMVIGGMAASSRYETRKILSYHIISQIGYMIMGLAIYTPLSIAGGIFFALHNMVAKTNTFVVAGLVNRMRGSYSLKQIGGLFRQSPVLAFLFLVPAFALAGIPPLSGFFAKFILIKAGFEDGHYIITGIAVFSGLLTLYSMIKIWNEAFLKKSPVNEREVALKKPGFIDLLPSFILGGITICMGIFAAEVFEWTMQAADSLMDPALYISTILGK